MGFNKRMSCWFFGMVIVICSRGTLVVSGLPRNHVVLDPSNIDKMETSDEQAPEKRLSQQGIASWVLHKGKHPSYDIAAKNHRERGLDRGTTAAEASSIPNGSSSSSSSSSHHVKLLEEHLSQRVRVAESRILKKVNEKLRILNQTLAISHLEKLHHHVLEELSVVRETSKERGEFLKSFQREESLQEAEVLALRATVASLQHSVANLTALVNQLAAGALPPSATWPRPNHPKPSRPSPRPPTSGKRPPAKSSGGIPFNPLFPVDCEDVQRQGGMDTPGDYFFLVQPYLSREPFKACCRLNNHSGWTMIQRRMDGSVDFFRTWEDYKRGFGILDTEFWLGNEHIFQLTNQDDYKLRIEMTDWEGNNYWAEYDHFRIGNEADMYRLHVHGYHGDAGDSFTSPWENHNNQPFSTKDSDNDNRFYDSCAKHYQGAWWFKSCFESHLNGLYYHRGSHDNFFVRNGIQWNTIHLHSSLKTVVMMITPNAGIHESDPDSYISNDINHE